MTETLLNWNWTILWIETEAKCLKFQNGLAWIHQFVGLGKAWEKDIGNLFLNWIALSSFTITPRSQQITWLVWKGFFYHPNMMDLSGVEKDPSILPLLGSKPDILVRCIPALLQVMTVLMTWTYEHIWHNSHCSSDRRVGWLISASTIKKWWEWGTGNLRTKILREQSVNEQF